MFSEKQTAYLFFQRMVQDTLFLEKGLCHMLAACDDTGTFYSVFNAETIREVDFIV